MARVCEELYPKGSYPYQKLDGFHMDDLLKQQLDILIKNVVKDWDFTIIITGGGEVRVGKSVLAMQIARYWTEQVNKIHNKDIILDVKKNFIFDGRELIKQGNFLGINYPYSALIFDEAGADLEGRKVMQNITQDVMDYYRECGQYNMLNLLVLPDYFDLPKGIALSRSICLIDVYYSADKEYNFVRGYFNFYSRPNKKMLYLLGKRNLNYRAYPYDFQGKFDNVYTINESLYREAKLEALRKRESKRRNKFQIQRDACWYLLINELGWSREDLCRRMENLTGVYVGKTTVNDGLSHFYAKDK